MTEQCPTCKSSDMTKRGTIECEWSGGAGRLNLHRERWSCADPWHEPEAHAPATPATGNYVCDDDTFPTSVTFDNGRVVKIVGAENAKPYLEISPKSEYPKPCGICDGVIQSKDDLDWHGYGNCRDIPEAIFNSPKGDTGKDSQS